jgi:hypothetical protein
MTSDAFKLSARCRKKAEDILPGEWTCVIESDGLDHGKIIPADGTLLYNASQATSPSTQYAEREPKPCNLYIIAIDGGYHRGRKHVRYGKGLGRGARVTNDDACVVMVDTHEWMMAEHGIDI